MKKSAIILLVLIGFTFLVGIVKTFNAIMFPQKYETLIVKNATEQKLSSAVVASVINIESSYNKNAISNKDAIGLMQIKLETANYMCAIFEMQTLSKKELLDADTNIKLGCIYLRYLFKKFNNIETAICAYNAGETKVRSWLNSDYSKDGKTLNSIPYLETKNYLKKFKTNLKIYEKRY